jgi:hypothetical protein
MNGILLLMKKAPLIIEHAINMQISIRKAIEMKFAF